MLLGFCMQIENALLCSKTEYSLSDSGRSKGGTPPRTKISLISWGFSQNIFNLSGWCLHLRAWRPLLRQVLNLPLSQIELSRARATNSGRVLDLVLQADKCKASNEEFIQYSIHYSMIVTTQVQVSRLSTFRDGSRATPRSGRQSLGGRD